MVKRLIIIVSKKLNEGYRADYEDKINHYIQILQKRSFGIDPVYNLPEELYETPVNLLSVFIPDREMVL